MSKSADHLWFLSPGRRLGTRVLVYLRTCSCSHAGF
ncbi:unnamed protein product [Ectocarpus sp. CCAP 1310/34]|nr:unnamed protein product [Ectocarpus sp. CCAP 1310/34]